ncbi:TonB-dependent receptor [Malaciobacter halophilus]|uniref:TonB-dependent receptor n=1 Tax=Malaciobacter halophilus TaxID=197482 RepID=A0A2N1J3B6_9BACT|nr:TonB-dependent receptor [Malaciobacter halophilus]AXH09155.1 TonB-dependent receptor [Malaciobacter halophilus]PKI81049.1 TonB-dependent receptor [Malaciobacter halophilus]
MRKTLALSLFAIYALSANEEISLDSVVVTDTLKSKIVNDISNENLKSADLAQALSEVSPSISLVRRSGIANDIIVRGQKKDNINILLDDAKIYGACPNRMDPPTSHVLSNNIQSVEVVEGPYDVENFGTLSAKVKVNTKKPKEGFNADVNVNYGSYGYSKYSATLSGGTKDIKALISASTESSEQYEDGDGNTLAQQLEKNSKDASRVYSDKYKDMDAYEKKSFMSKLYFNLNDKQEINLSYTANRSDDILYANTGMDAIYDDSDIYSFNYIANDLSKFSKKLKFNTYYSKVDHPMATTYRKNGAMEMTNHMKSKIKGAKLQNDMNFYKGTLTLGLDTSKRTWEGKYSNKSNPYLADSISKTDTKNKAAFIKYNKDINSLNIELASRYDKTDIKTDGNEQDNDYNSLSAYLLTTYKVNNSLNFFAGIGKSSRVPDARELYFKKSGKLIGTPNLDKTTNYEIDLGFEKTFTNFKIKTKFFYSTLKNYIAFNDSKTINKFENVDAKIYGFDVSGYYYATDEIYFDYAVAYQRGKKDEALDGQSDTDLAEIPPLKTTLAFNYEEGKNRFRAALVAAKAWSNYDEDNAEQRLAGYGILNLKYENSYINNTVVTLGVDNVFDKTYATSNTYKDLTLLSSTSDEVMLLNEPGRYVYVNIKYSF